MKATEQYFPVVLFIMLYKVVVAFEPVQTKALAKQYAYVMLFEKMILFFSCFKVVLTKGVNVGML